MKTDTRSFSENCAWHQDSAGLFHFASTVNEGDILALAANIIEQGCVGRELIGDNKDAERYFSYKLSRLKYEVFSVLFLDTKHRIICYQQLFRGTIDSCSVPVREVVVEALKHNAGAVIFAHNHPSGVSEPSASDRSLTDHLKIALDIIGVRVLDHIIVGTEGIHSMAERGEISI